METIINAIKQGKTSLGIEFGSTRIKAVLLGEDLEIIEIGIFDWENKLENGVWTYRWEDVWEGLQSCYADLLAKVKEKYKVEISTIGSIGISGMMHGYMAFDQNDQILVPFRTWRNTMTEEASQELTDLLGYQIPQRWSIAHLYQAILNQEKHVSEITTLTTLAGYVHWMLTGEKVLGVGEASGMFPIDCNTKDYHEKMIQKFDEKITSGNFPWKIRDILPKVLVAGEKAKRLTSKGAKLLDRSGVLQEGILFSPPEGDAGTGMVATNSIRVRSGNVSAGTSVFAMIVLEKELKKVYSEIDLVTTPEGNLVGMVHCNNCTSDLNAWVQIFKEFAESFGMTVDMNQLFGVLYQKSLEADPACTGLLNYNYFSGEHITGLDTGRPLFVRSASADFTLANFMRTQIYSSLASLKIGLDILLKEEQVSVDTILGHGGFFKTKGVGQKMLAAAIEAPVSVMESASEGGAYGSAILAAYAQNCERSLSEYLDQVVFANQRSETLEPDQRDVDGFAEFMKRYKKGLEIEKAATIYVDEK